MLAMQLNGSSGKVRFFFLGYNYFIFKTQGPPTMISSQTHLKDFYGCPE